MTEIPRGAYNDVATLEALLRKYGYVMDAQGCWRKDDLVLVIGGSRVNGFYLAELRK